MKTRTPLFRIDRLLIAALALLAAPLAHAQTTTNVFFFEDFNDSNSTSLGSATNTNNATSYLWTKGGAGGTNNNRTAIVSSNLVISNTSPAGRDFAFVSLTNTSGFNTSYSSSTATSLEWYVNMRQTRSDPSGFDSSGYGAAFIIGASSSNFTGAGVTGYALLYGQSGATDPLRFAYFTNGLALNSSIVNVITSTNTGADIGAQFLSLKLTYNVTSNSWSLFGTTNASFVDPWTNSSLVSYGTASNSTYTGTSLSFMGGFWNYATGAGENAFFDNIRVASVSAVISGSSFYWTANSTTLGGSGTWNTSGSNWSSATSPVSGGLWDSTKTAVFTNNAATVTVSTVSANAGVQFATDGYTLNSGTITLGGSAIASNTITTDASVGATINSVLAGTAGMTKAGSGTLTLGGANTYTGGTAVTGGRLVGDTTSLRGNITNTAAVSFNQSTNGTYASVLSGSGGTVTKSGAGTVTFTQNNTYTGSTTVSGGRLVVNGSQSSSAVTVNSGGASLAGTGTVGALTVSGLLAPGTSIGTLSAGNTTFSGGGALELEIFDWVNTAGTGWDLFAVTGNLTLSNTAGSPFAINLVSLQDSTTPGLSTDWNQNANFTNTFITYSGSLLGTSFASNLFSVNTNGFQNPVNGTFSITNVSGGLALLYTTAFVPASEYIWNTGAGAWGTAGSWSGGVAPSNNSAVIFSGAGGASTNNLVNTVQSLLFSNTAGSYTISGDSLTVGALGVDNESTAAQTINNNLTLGAAQSFLAANGNLTFGGTVNNGGFLLTVAGASNTVVNGAISGNGGLTKSGTGSLTLSNNTFSGALAANGGTTLVNGTQATTTVNVGGGTLLLGAADRLANGATVALTTGTVNLGGNTDTIATFNQSGGVFTNGTLTATTYGLSGGTVGGTLGAGTANVTGGITLSGAINSTLNVNSGGSVTASGTAGGAVNINTGGTFTLAAADRIGNSSAVTVNAGTLATATFDDTVGSVVLTNNGAITGSGTITAGTYTLNGGTVGANLGTGTATSSAGTTTLNGTLAGGLAVSGGTVNLGSGDRIGNSSAVTVSSGTLGLGANNDTVGNFTITGGTLGGSGILTASTYALQGGNVNAVLGTGAVTVSSGTTTLGSAGRLNSASTLTVDSGQVTLGGSETVASLAGSGGTVALGANTLTAGGGNASTTYSGVFTGAGTLAKTGTGSLTLGGDNSSYAGTVNLQAGAIIAANNNALGTAAVTLTNGSLFAASGVTTTNSITIGTAASSTVYYSENFNTIGSGLPTGWTVRTGANASSLGTTNALTTTAGINTAWSNTTGAFKNFASATGLTQGATIAEQEASTDRALGVRTTSGFGDNGAAFTYQFNTLGQTITNISFDLMLLAVEGRTNVWSLQYGVGATPASYTTLGTWTAPDVWGTTATNFTSGLFSTNLNNQSDLVFRIVTLSASSGSGSRDSVGIDNFVINKTGGAATGSGTLGISEAGTATFSGNVLNNTAATLTAASNGLATFSGIISGAGWVTKTGDGTVTLSGANTYSGGTVVSAGTLAGDTAGVRGAITNNATVNFAITTNGTYSGAMTGAGALTKSGAATLTTTGVNNFSGATTISAGTLLVNGTNANSAVTINSGATLGGSGSVGAVTVNGVIAPGTSPGTLSVSSITLNGGGSYLWEITNATAAAGTGWDVINVGGGSGTITLGATSGSQFTINVIGTNPSNFVAATSRTWDIIDAGSFEAFDASAFAINTDSFTATGTLGTWSVANNSGNLQLLYNAPSVATYIWNQGSGDWSDTANWVGASSPTNGAPVIFAGAGGGASTNDNTVTSLGSLVFSNSAGSYTLSGTAFTNGAAGIVNNSPNAQTISNGITLGAAQSFDAAAGNLTFAGAIDNNGNPLTIEGNSNTVVSGAISGSGGLTKSGTGSLTLGGNSSYTGALNANGGTTLANGTQETTTINVGGGTLLLGASDVLANGATVALTTGTVNLGGGTDTITTFNQSGGVFTNGTLTATTYGLSGGTVGGTLSGGTANVTGAVSLSGNINSTLNVNSGGTLTLASNDRIGDSSVVTVNAGNLATATFNDTVGSLVLTNSGSITGSGTITAATYTLNGGTVSANLGLGTATSTAGTTTLSGTLAGDLAVSGGTLTLGAADRLGNSSAVTVSLGTLNFGTFTNTVGSFSLSGGVFTNGTLTAGTYGLSGGTVAGNLGAGTATVSNGITALNGTLGATTVNVNSGALNLGSANRLANTAAITLSGGTLGMSNFNDTVGSLILSGGTLDGTTGTLTAATYGLQSGTINARLGAGAVTVSNGTTTLGSAGRLNSASTLAVNGGQLTLAGAETVSTYTQTGGTLGGSGQTLTAGSYALQGGTIDANLGTGTATASTGTTTINGNLGGALTASSGTANLNGTVAGNVTVSGGTVNLGSAERISSNSAVAVNSGALNLNGNDSVASVQITGGSIAGSGVLTATSNYDVQGGTISAALGGSAAMTKSGAGTATLSGDNSGYTGAVTVGDGTLLASHNNAFGSSAVSVTNGSVVANDGRTIANNFTIGSAGGLQSFYSQNFNSMGTSATASLPTDWKMSAAAQGTTSTFWTNAGNLTATTIAASSGSPNTGGRYNWGFSNDANNRAIGFMTSGGYKDPNSIMFAFTNTTGQTITDFTVSFDYLRFRTNSTAISNVFYMSDSSTSWGSAISTNVWATGTSGYNFAPAPVSLTNTISLTITNGGVAYMMWAFDPTTDGNSQGIGLDNVSINTPGGPTGTGTLGINEVGSATFSGNILNNTAATFTAASGGTATFSGAISGAGTLSKTGIGTVTLSGVSANTFTGTTTVSAGTLQLNKTAETDAIAGDIEVNDGAFLLLSSSGNVADTAEITLSGGTITRGTGVSETFGALNLTDASALDFGSGTGGQLRFGVYEDGTTPSALLSVSGFFQGNSLVFGSNIGSFIASSSAGPYTGTYFSFDQGFTTTAWNGSTFTITAIPEPSTYLAVVGLLGLMLWPSRKRLLKDAKKILGITPPMRDRLAAKRA